MLQDMGRITTAVQHCVIALRCARLNVIHIEIVAGGLEGQQTLSFDASSIQPEGVMEPDDDTRFEFCDSLIPEPHMTCVYDEDIDVTHISTEDSKPGKGA